MTDLILKTNAATTKQTGATTSSTESSPNPETWFGKKVQWLADGVTSNPGREDLTLNCTMFIVHEILGISANLIPMQQYEFKAESKLSQDSETTGKVIPDASILNKTSPEGIARAVLEAKPPSADTSVKGFKETFKNAFLQLCRQAKKAFELYPSSRKMPFFFICGLRFALFIVTPSTVQEIFNADHDSDQMLGEARDKLETNIAASFSSSDHDVLTQTLNASDSMQQELAYDFKVEYFGSSIIDRKQTSCISAAFAKAMIEERFNCTDEPDGFESEPSPGSWLEQLANSSGAPPSVEELTIGEAAVHIARKHASRVANDVLRAFLYDTEEDDQACQDSEKREEIEDKDYEPGSSGTSETDSSASAAGTSSDIEESESSQAESESSDSSDAELDSSEMDISASSPEGKPQRKKPATKATGVVGVQAKKKAKLSASRMSGAPSTMAAAGAPVTPPRRSMPSNLQHAAFGGESPLTPGASDTSMMSIQSSNLSLGESNPQSPTPKPRVQKGVANTGAMFGSGSTPIASSSGSRPRRDNVATQESSPMDVDG